MSSGHVGIPEELDRIAQEYRAEERPATIKQNKDDQDIARDPKPLLYEYAKVLAQYRQFRAADSQIVRQDGSPKWFQRLHLIVLAQCVLMATHAISDLPDHHDCRRD